MQFYILRIMSQVSNFLVEGTIAGVEQGPFESYQAACAQLLMGPAEVMHPPKSSIAVHCSGAP